MNKGYTEIDNKFYQEAQVVMLPTKVSNIYKDKKDKLWYWASPTLETSVAQHLYFLSNEEIKEGDYYIHFGISPNTGPYQTVNQCHKGLHKSSVYDNLVKPDYNKDTLFIDGMFATDCKKIIATTDSELQRTVVEEKYDDINSPLPTYLKVNILLRSSNSFIEKFISEWNKGNKIDKVLVEMDRICKKENCASTYPLSIQCISPKSCFYSNFNIKVAPDNTITIKQLVVKDSWTREQHCNDMQYYMEYCQSNGYVTPMKWLNELKHY